MTLEQFTSFRVIEKLEALNNLFKGNIKFENSTFDMNDIFKGFNK